MALLLLGAVLIVHHPVFWIDHILWDEVSFEVMANTGDLSGKLFSTLHQSIPTAYPLYSLFAWLPEPTLALRMGALVSLWITTVAVTSVLMNFAAAPRDNALAAGLLTLTFPAYQMYANAGTAFYVISLALFAVAVWCGLIGLRAASRWSQGWFVPAAGFLVTSFVLQAFFVYVYGVAAAIFALSLRKGKSMPHGTPFLGKWQRTRVVVLLLAAPPINYFFLRHFFPLHPYFGSAKAGYNVPQLEPDWLLRGFLRAFDNSIAAPITRFAEMSVVQWILCGAVSFGAGFLALRRPSLDSSSNSRGHLLLLLAAGIVLLGAGLFPFIAVGKPPDASGVHSRFALLVAPSLAVAFAGLLGWAREPRVRVAVWAIMGLLLTGWMLQHWQAYVDWEVCSIKNRVIVRELKKLPPPPASYFIIHGDNLEHTYQRQFYDWGRLFHEAWDDSNRLGLAAGRYPPVPSPFYTSLGLTRDHVQNFRLWMGYGPPPEKPDTFSELFFNTTADFAISGARAWRIVAIDLWRRCRYGRVAANAALPAYITGVQITPAAPYTFDSARLLPGGWMDSGTRWMRAASHPVISADKDPARITVFGQTQAEFSVISAPDRGGLFRCDRHNGPAARTAQLDVKIEIPPHPVGTEAPHVLGIAISVDRVTSTVPPLLVLVMEDGTEIEGFWRSLDSESLEAWSPPHASSRPARAWLIWRPREAGARLRCHSVRTGWVPLGRPFPPDKPAR